MNRSILLIPAICGDRNEVMIQQALNKASQAELEKWGKENTPDTMRKKGEKTSGIL